MKRNRLLITLSLFTGVFAFALGACGDDDGGTDTCGNGVCDTGETYESCPADCDAPVCNNDGICDAADGETPANCDDCVVTGCSLTDGDANNFLVSEIYIPDSAAAAAENGVDLNGDGEIDNKIGQILALVATQGGDFNVNETVNAEIASGSVLLVGRVVANDISSDDEVAVQILQGMVVNDATPQHQGNDTVGIDPNSPDDIFICGQIDSGDLQAGPAQLNIAFPIPQLGLLELTLERAQIVGQVTAAGWTNVMVGGGITPEEMDQNLFPFAVQFLNAEASSDPSGTIATTVVPLFDANCDTNVCPDATPGSGECADDGVLTVTEIKCNSMIHTALGPDVDTDGDGEPDMLSIGLKVVSALPVTVQ